LWCLDRLLAPGAGQIGFVFHAQQRGVEKLAQAEEDHEAANDGREMSAAAMPGARMLVARSTHLLKGAPGGIGGKPLRDAVFPPPLRRERMVMSRRML